jgi:hypothetical protein
MSMTGVTSKSTHWTFAVVLVIDNKCQRHFFARSECFRSIFSQAHTGREMSTGNRACFWSSIVQITGTRTDARRPIEISSYWYYFLDKHLNERFAGTRKCHS